MAISEFRSKEFNIHELDKKKMYILIYDDLKKINTYSVANEAQIISPKFIVEKVFKRFYVNEIIEFKKI